MINDLNILLGLKKFCLAVSGGVDSIALMAIVKDWLNSLPEDNKPEIVIMTVNHNFREESANEVIFVKNLAEKLGFKCEILENTEGKPKSRPIEFARVKRYQLIASACKRLNLQAIVTAHHLDDQIETFFMRLSRGSGIKGLSSMEKISNNHDLVEGMLIVRPFLDRSKSELLNYIKSQGLQHIEDPSNQDAQYERVRIRNKLATINKELGTPLFSDKSIIKSLERLKRADEALDFIAINNLIEQNKSNKINRWIIEREIFDNYPTELKIRTLLAIINQFISNQKNCTFNNNKINYGSKYLQQCEDFIDDIYKASENSNYSKLSHINSNSNIRFSLGGLIFSFGERYLRVSKEPTRSIKSIDTKNSKTITKKIHQK